MTAAPDLANDRSPMRTASHVARGGRGGEAPGAPPPPTSPPGRWPGPAVPKVLDCCTMDSFWTPFWYPVFLHFG